jgi:hypothetical protein
MSKRFVSTARQIPGGFFTPGQHAVVIESIMDEQSRVVKEWKDRTPQVKVTFRNDSGVLSHWYNLKGFKKLNKEENPKAIAPKGFEYRQASDDAGNGIGEFYLVNTKTGIREEDEAATETAMSIFSGMASDAGIAAGTAFDLEDLKGRQIGIMVRNRAENGKVEIHYTMPAEKVVVADEIGA